MILAFAVCVLAGVVVGAVTVAAWAMRHAPFMEDEPSFLDRMDWGDDERADGDDA